MKKSALVFSLAAAAGFSALSAAPALAVTGAYPNCSAAAAEGVYNIPIGAPGYGAHLDSDSDGVGCENSDAAYAPAPAAPVEAPQVGQMPVGAPDTGITQENTSDLDALALGGGLVLAAAAGGTYLVRRRSAGRV